MQKFPSVETVPHFQTTVIPGEPKHLWRDPESRKLVENQTILDPDSHPALRDLVGMTNFDTVP